MVSPGCGAVEPRLRLTNTARENCFVVDVALNPAHQLLDVCRRGHFRRPLVVLGVLPQILKSGPVSVSPNPYGVPNLLIGRLHLRARLRGAELGDGAIDQVDLVVKVHHCRCKSARIRPTASRSIRRTIDGQPLVLVFALRQLHHLAQAATAECRLGILAKLEASSATFAGHSGSELVLRPVVSVIGSRLAQFLSVASAWGWVPIRALGCRQPRRKVLRLLWCGRRDGTIDGSPLCRCSRQQKINSHGRQKGAHGENQEPGLSQKDVPELRPPEQGTALAGQSLMTQPAGDSPPAPAESGQGMRTDAS